MNIVAITQARVGSSRLPGKILKEICQKTLLELHLERALQSKLINKLIVATTTEEGVEKIIEVARKVNVDVYQGSLNDVLDRYYQAAKGVNADYIVRITSDCPLLDAKLIDKVVQFALDQQLDYVSNTLETTFPDGQDVEVFRFSALEKAWKEARLNSEREHVTAYIWKNSSFFKKELFTSSNYSSEKDYGNVRLTVDEQRDFDTVNVLIKALGMKANWETYADYFISNATNMHNEKISRNEGYSKSLVNDN